MTEGHKNARQYGDQMMCSHCGKSWDVNDIDPPQCSTSASSARTLGHLQQLRRAIKNHRRR